MLRNDLLRDVVFTPGLRPSVSQTLVRQFEQKRRRLSPGYSPQAPTDLIDWVKERLLIPASEWEALLDAISERSQPRAGRNSLSHSRQAGANKAASCLFSTDCRAGDDAANPCALRRYRIDRL